MLGSMVTPVQGDLGQTAATPPHDASDSEEEDDSFVLQRTSTVKDGRSAPASGEAADDSALRANPGFRVKNTFIHVDEEVGTGMGRTESDQFAATRTQSDPSGSNVRLPRWPSRQAPRVPAVPEDSSEAPAESDSDESGEQRTHKELERFETWDHFAAQAHGYAGSLPMPGADVPPMMPMIPVGMPQEGYQMPAAFGWPGASDQMTLAPSTGPAFGLVHSFHKEVRGFGLASPDLRQFTKGQDYEGRLSVISGSEVQRGGVQKYLMQFSDGELTKADGVGFVFASRVPCAKNIQKIVSVFVNQRGRICMRVFGDILKAKKHVRALQVGDWIEMAIDLENSIATFKVWSYETVASGYMPMEPDSTAEFHYGKRLAQANQLSAKPVKLNVGHFACVIQNVGVTDFKEPAQPLNGLEAPRSRRAADVVKYLWEEAQWDQQEFGLYLGCSPPAMRGGKRKRHNKKLDLNKVQFKVAKKRGKTVVTAEKAVQKTKAEIEDEIKKLKAAKKAAVKSKARRRKQPAPILERKALDYLPVDAGMRKDLEARRARREATRVAREERRARRQEAREKKERLGKEEVSLKDVLGGDFFGADGIAPDLD
ncbi:unnamed protein product [Symbiodinium microadriaticum]|nr:unnamed protein product [Symbiodinium microadriaticum]